MINKQQPKKTRVHPELTNFDISVTQFGEIDGNFNIDKINQFLNKNVIDKKLNNSQLELT